MGGFSHKGKKVWILLEVFSNYQKMLDPNGVFCNSYTTAFDI